MLERQEKLLKESLRNQKKQSGKLQSFEGKLVSFEDRFDDLDTSLSSDPSKKKIKVTHDLTVSASN